MLFGQEIERIAARIKEEEEKKREFADIIKKLRDKIEIKEVDDERVPVIDEKLIVSVGENFYRPQSVAGVDGGLLAREYHGIDIILTRAVGVIFHYDDQWRLVETEYHPKPNPFPWVKVVSDPLSEPEFRILASIERQATELRVAEQIASKYSPEIILMDGSICPHPAFKPPSDSQLKDDYNRLIMCYKDLYKAAIKNNVVLAGVVEDSRANKFNITVTDTILPALNSTIRKSLKTTAEYVRNSRDTHFLYYLLDRGERTFTFKYSTNRQNPIMRDISPWSPHIYSFYLKTANYDRPLRIDFVSKDKNITAVANRIASSLLFLSCHHSVYGIPTILIECDSRAKLRREDIDFIYAAISDKVGKLPSMFELRRNIRPF